MLFRSTTAEEACRVAERIRRGVGVVRVLTKDMIVGATVSIGIAALGSHGGTLVELLESADQALYEAKRAGRDRICLANPAAGG